MLAHATEHLAVFPLPHSDGTGILAPAHLTRKESQLLAALQQNAGHCLSRQYLLTTIWGYQNGTRTRTLDVHIQRLRRKLGADGASRIMTVLRTGYAWQG
jgi:two-component system alkaline phosphatase synthesis response regulator PhoP